MPANCWEACGMRAREACFTAAACYKFYVSDISIASHRQVPCALEPCRRASASSGVAAADIDLAAARIPPHVCMKSFA